MKLETGKVLRTVAAAFLAAAGTAVADARRLMSPDGSVSVEISVTPSNRLMYAVSFRGKPVVAPSAIGLTLDGKDLGRITKLTAVNVREVHERFPVRGAHAEGRYDALVALFTAMPCDGPSYGVQFSIANEGFAWRFLVPGQGLHRVAAEAAGWQLPLASRVWYAERLSDWKLKTYAGEWLSAPLRQLPDVSPQGPVQTMPLIAELPEGLGYAAVTEAALFRYSGLRLECLSGGVLRGVFAEKDGFTVEGPFRTPWRVVLLAPTLDALVNSDLIVGLNPPPDPALFGAGEWTAGGRSVWSWWQGEPDYMAAESEKRMIDYAARLKFEFTTLDEGWESWTNAWDTLKEVCDYGRTNSVRVFVWKHSKELNVPASQYAVLRTFLDRVKAAGAAGVKIDFMNGEDAGLIAFDEWVLQEAAARQLLVNFHGCQKPSGECRTYPNEVTREAVRGLELNRITEHHLKKAKEKGKEDARRVGMNEGDTRALNAQRSTRNAEGVGGEATARPHVPGGENQNIPASHNAALPFTRGVAGHADYTPIAFSRPGETTWPHQLAMAYLVTSPLVVMAEHPRRLFSEPRLEPVIPFLQELPVSWDETRVLEGSRIGEVAALARRKGSVWYVAMVNGTASFKMVPFAARFTGWGRAKMTQVADVPGKASDLALSDRFIKGDEPVIVSLEPNGGFVAKIVRE